MKEQKMLLVYCAGAYSAPTSYKVRQNIRAAELTAEAIMALDVNLYPVCPHANTAHCEGLRRGSYFIKGTMKQLESCQALLLVQEYKGTGPAIYHNSEGTIGELARAKELGIPVFYTLQGLLTWYKRLQAQNKKQEEANLWALQNGVSSRNLKPLPGFDTIEEEVEMWDRQNVEEIKSHGPWVNDEEFSAPKFSTSKTNIWEREGQTRFGLALAEASKEPNLIDQDTGEKIEDVDPDVMPEKLTWMRKLRSYFYVNY